MESPPPATVNPGTAATALGHRSRTLRERLQLEHPHGTVPQDRRRPRPSTRPNSSAVLGPMSRPIGSLPGSRRPPRSGAPTPRWPRGGHHEVEGQHHVDSALLGALEGGQAVVIPLGLDERRPTRSPAPPGTRRPSPRRPEGVHPVDERVHHGQLVGDLGPAEDRHEGRPGRRGAWTAPRPRAASAGPRRPAAAGRRPPHWRARGGRRRTRRRRRRAQSGELGGERGVVLLLARVEAKVLEERHRAGGGRRDGRLDAGPVTSSSAATERSRTSASRTATGRRRSPSTTSPLGRPRWQHGDDRRATSSSG